MSNVIRLAVLSDLHFCSDEKGKEETHVILNRQEIAKQHPYRDLIGLIESGKLQADALLCPGDITFQADQTALKYAWNAINDIATRLGTEHVFASTGNHDISSRDSVTSPEIWEYLKQLEPQYPYTKANQQQRLFYWAEHFLIAEFRGVRIVILNSCNSHSRGKEEYLHGRVTDYTISRLEAELKKREKHALNVLLCHHHPMKHPDLSQHYPDYSEMKQGLKLLDSLAQTKESWLVIHGHKHNPRLDYAQGPSTHAPIVFSAGSFSAVLSPGYFPGATNQFYIIELDLEYISENGKAGTVLAWDWQEGQGWIEARCSTVGTKKIPHGSGFGHKSNHRHDARVIASKYSEENHIPWSKVQSDFPWLRYVTPADLEQVVEHLKDDHAFDINCEQGNFWPKELLKRTNK